MAPGYLQETLNQHADVVDCLVADDGIARGETDRGSRGLTRTPWASS
jgi:hypothetical protein